MPDVRVGRGNHEAFGNGLLPLRGWYPLEILHFPVRSLEHCMRKYVTQFVALDRNADKGIPDHMAEAYAAYRAGRLEQFYEPLVVDSDALARGLEDGSLAYDTRLRDQLRDLGFGARRRDSTNPVGFGRPDVSAAVQYAVESSVLEESDLAIALGARIDDLESRVQQLERRALTRVGRVARRGLRW